MVFNSKNEQLFFFVTPPKRHKRYTVVGITQKLWGKIIFWCKSEPSKMGDPVQSYIENPYVGVHTL
jgi:hypothetical protein